MARKSKKPDLESPDLVTDIPDVLPVLPLKDAVLFPYIILPLSVRRDKSMVAIDRALATHRLLLLVSQRDPTVDDPDADGLYSVGTAAAIMRMLKLPDGRTRILVQGLARARLEHLGQTEPFLQGKIQLIEEARIDDKSAMNAQALTRNLKENLDHVVNLGRGISPEVMVIASNLDDPGRLADLAASNLEIKVDEGQQVLEISDPIERLEKVNKLLNREVQVLTMQQEISSQARGEMDRSQREYYLRQQLQAIRDELGEGDELASDIEGYRRAVKDKELSTIALEEMERQIRRLERSHPESAETSVLRTYLDWLTDLPWNTYSADNLDLDHARRILDEDHFELEKIKERIIEYLAVRRLKKDSRGPILCFVGPPGVGKTSLGRSIARALGRQFVHLSLGGVRDEAEIRGHRRTYVGALPGRILQSLRQAGTSNPVFMLDEIDKIGADYRSDPSSALLEVLDPEHNSSFSDHFLGLPYDLSQVLFIATANLLDPIQPAFLDRLEVLRLTGYTEDEKQQIAKRHLIPKQTEAHGIDGKNVAFTRPGISCLISSYTKEAGLRNLEREIAAVCRKVAVRVARGEDRQLRVTPKQIERLLGPAKFHLEELLSHDRVGVATGLAWTAAGGDLLFIEAVATPGKGDLVLTGQLGEVMRESAQAALSFARVYAARQAAAEDSNGADSEFFSKHNIHVHVPAGSIPKDGPSAGITMATAIISVFTGRPVNRRLAMTGEITLRGDILPIGGLKEKIMAARLAGVETLLLPKLNQRDLVEVPEPIKKGLTFKFAEHLGEVLEHALLAK